MARPKKTDLPAAAEQREQFPSSWSDIRGHAEVIRRLRTLAAAERLPHALIFTGAEGVGKRRTARVLARTLLCAADGDAPCGHCDACRTMAAGVHPDYFETAPEVRGKSTAMIRTDAVREILIAASGAPVRAARRIILIDGADCMNETAANRLLKTLEEPAGEVIFLLVTSAYDAVLPTIRSRAVRVAFGTLPHAEIAQVIAARGVPEAAVIAALADGSLGRAEMLAAEGLALRDDALAFLSAYERLTPEEIWQRAEELGARSHTARTDWIVYLQMALRDLLLLSADGGAAPLFHIDRRAELAVLRARMTHPQILALLDESRTLLHRLAANVNPALQAEAFLLRVQGT